MHGFFLLLKIDIYQFIELLYAFLLLPLLVVIFILCMVIYKKRIDHTKKIWEKNIAVLISEAIFFDSEEGDMLAITYNSRNLIQKPAFRQYLINEIINTRKSLSGISALNLKKLYESLQLDNDSYRKLNRKRWHITAKGIQELAIMEQVKYVKKIFKLTNNPNEYVRNEAQCALVSFYGFSGLRFLNVTTYPISELQQIQLLNVLHSVKPENFEDIKKWLQSVNESVIIFALKLATFYNCYNVYDNVINCLQHSDMKLKLMALKYLKIMPREDTADEIINHYFFKNKTYMLAILDTLKYVGDEKHIPFLLRQLNDKDDDIKAVSAKCISQLHPLGAAFLQSYSFADQKPWKEILLEIKSEHAA